MAGGTLFVAVLVLLVSSSSPAFASATTTCTATSGCVFTVPAGVSSVTFAVYGAAGGAAHCGTDIAGGLGGEATVTISVTPGEVFHLNVGEVGGTGVCTNAGPSTAAGGAGGAGDENGGPGGTTVSGSGPPNHGGGGGGGASDVRSAGDHLADRLIVAGGGGGAGGWSEGGLGGAGGGSPAASGVDGSQPGYGFGVGGGGATASAPGACGCGNFSYVDGAPGTGSDGGAGGAGGSSGGTTGGGGGGGYFGGGGGGAGGSGIPGNQGFGGGGGGGGSGGGSASGITFINGVAANNDGNGKVVVSYILPPSTEAATAVTATSATLNGTDPNGDSYHFEYGTTTSYGHSTPTATAATGTLSATVAGLTPATRYHYRIDSTEGGAGSDATFTSGILDAALSLKGPARGKVNAKLVYRLTLQNTGTAVLPLPLVHIVFAGSSPRYTFVSSGGCRKRGGRTLECSVRSLAIGQERQLEITIRVPKPQTLKVVGTIVNLDGFADPTPGDNAARIFTKTVP